MKKNSLWINLFFLILSACQFFASKNIPTPTSLKITGNLHHYPITDGAFWIYQGQIAYEYGDQVIEESVRWRVEVLESVSRPTVTGYLMRGSLYDLAFYTPDTSPSKYAILQIGQRFYNSNLETYNRLKDQSDDLYGLVQDTNLFLQLPLEAGSRFCETERITSDTGMWCWVVGEAELISLPGLPAQDILSYPISYVTNPDYSQFSFVPGVGFVAFIYHHNGTVSDVNVELVEYNLGMESP
jgi:hypothetical protein